MKERKKTENKGGRREMRNEGNKEEIRTEGRKEIPNMKKER
jgi:hypothetical protein